MSKKIPFLFLLLTLIFTTSCTEETLPVDDGNRNGEAFEDTPEAYILSTSTQAASTLPGYGQASSPFLIRNAAELKYFADAVNSGELHPFAIDPEDEEDLLRQESGDVHIVLAHDIQVEDGYAWTPIGTFAHPFKGSFKGENHSISGVLKQNMAINQERDTLGLYNMGASIAKYGFFGFTSDSEIENLTVDADIIPQKLDPTSSIGGIAAVAKGTHFNNCTFSGAIENRPSASMQKFYVGNLCGIGEYLTVEGCKSKGTFRLNKTYATSKNTFFATECYIGGLTGYSFEGTYTECENKAGIELDHFATAKAYIGGTFGRLIRTSLTGITNSGNIQISNVRLSTVDMWYKSICVGGVFGEGILDKTMGKTLNAGEINVRCSTLLTYVGGVCGNVQIEKPEFVDISNRGNVTNNSIIGYTGGCIGMHEGEGFSAINTGSVNSLCERCDTVAESGSTGGIVGRVYGPNKKRLANVRNEGDITSPVPFETKYGQQSYAGSIVGNAAPIKAGDCMNYGTVNGTLPGDNPTISMVGAIWLGWQRLIDGDMDYYESAEGQYWQEQIRQNIYYGD